MSIGETASYPDANVTVRTTFSNPSTAFSRNVTCALELPVSAHPEDPVTFVPAEADPASPYLQRLLAEAREAENVARAKRSAAQAASERLRAFRERLERAAGSE